MVIVTTPPNSHCAVAVAAAEVGIGLAIILLLFRNRRTANVDDFELMKL